MPACGGCDVAVLDTNEFILDVHAAADIRLWPIAVERQYADIEAMEDGQLDLAIYNGAVRNSENERIARLLRQKKQGAGGLRIVCASGGIPGLANLVPRNKIMNAAYLHNPSIQKGDVTSPARRAGERVHAHHPGVLQARPQLDDIVTVAVHVLRLSRPPTR